MRDARRTLVILAALLAVIGTSGCGDLAGTGGARAVVTTIAPIHSLTAQVAGGRVSVTAMIPRGQNGHTYQPRPSDARALADADLFIDNGLGLNQAVTDLAAANLPSRARIVFLGEDPRFSRELFVESGSAASCHQGHCHGGAADVPNAHLWPDPIYAMAYVEKIAVALSDLQPGDESVFQKNAADLRKQIGALHDAIRAATLTIPPENRKMVVYHDAWSYFARRYGLRVAGAFQPSDFSEPSAAEVRGMVEQIKGEKVPAFFGSEVFPSDVLDAVAEESGTVYVKEISDDRLPGEPGDPEHTYVGMMTANARAIVTALGGDDAALTLLGASVSQ